MLFRKLFVFIVAFLLASCATTTVRVSKPTLPELGRGATVAFVTRSLGEENNVFPYCSGVWISKDTMITALHCAQGAATLAEIRKLPPELMSLAPLIITEVKDPTGAEMSYIVDNEVVTLSADPKATHKSKVLAIDPKHDLAIVKADLQDLPNHLWLRVASEMPKVGDKVFIVGHPGKLYFTFMDGIVAAIRENEIAVLDKYTTVEGPFLQIFSGIYEGSSGGPVISQNGEIVGIVSFVVNTPNQGFAIASPSIKQFIFRVNSVKNNK